MLQTPYPWTIVLVQLNKIRIRAFRFAEFFDTIVLIIGNCLFLHWFLRIRIIEAAEHPPSPNDCCW